jgi:ATP-dependent Clp protease ATP-binding subunit ClpC
LVLFDEIEKAHPEVFNILLQILEDGRLTDGKGRAIDFSNTITIMTSNIGAEKLQKESVLGFQASSSEDKDDLGQLHEQNKEKVIESLKKMMRPELLNRIDKSIVFRALTKSQIKQILELQLDELGERLVSHGLAIRLENSAKTYLVEKGYDPQNGVRPLRRLIQDTIEDKLSSELLQGRYEKGDLVSISVRGGELVFSRVEEPSLAQNS